MIAVDGLRIALVTETFPPEVNGVAMTLSRWTEGLRRRGHAVQVVRPRQQSETCATAADVLVAGLPMPGYRGLRFGLPATQRLRQVWRHTRPDVVHVATEGPLGASAAAVAHRLGVPVSSSYHTHFADYCKHYGFGWLKQPVAGWLRRFHQRCAQTFVPTHALADELAAQGYRNVAVISRGVDTALFNPARRSQALRASWGVGADDLVVAYVGRLAAEKNLTAVLDAFTAIQGRRRDARLVFVGDGPAGKGLAARHPQHVFAGMRHDEDLATHYASCDLFLFPSLTETFGNTVSEALASGLAVVAYRRAAAAELVRDGVNGRLATPGDHDAFVAAAAGLAGSPHLLAAQRAQAAASVAALDWERICDDFAGALALIATRRVPLS